jgi:hypothetical protein
VPLDEAADAIEAHHLVKRVVHRAQIRIDLLRHVARQEAEPLAGLDCRPHEHDAPDGVARERLDRGRDREERLAGAGRSDPEREVALAHRARIRDLVRAARANTAPARVDRKAVLAGYRLERVVAHVLGERDVHALGVELLGGRELEQVLEYTTAAPRRVLFADELETVSTVVDLDRELALDLAQMLVELAGKRREAARIVGAQDHAERVLSFCGGVRQRTSASRPRRGDPSVNYAAAP